MEHESFENNEIAQILNDHYVSIKVDREERPDVDRVYMTYLQVNISFDDFSLISICFFRQGNRRWWWLAIISLAYSSITTILCWYIFSTD
jgi:hypothetical protein